MKKILVFFGLLGGLAFLTISMVQAATTNNLSQRLSGKILIQVQDKGRAWYVNPANNQKYSLGQAADAFGVMRNLGVGISNVNLEKIPVADANLSGTDTDQDGLSDAAEDALGTDKNKADSDGDGYNDKDEVIGGYNPTGSGKSALNNVFSRAQSGKILLQVESHGEAWYVNPDNNKRYFLNRPSDAFNVMRSLGLGISNQNLSQIKESSASQSQLSVPDARANQSASTTCTSLSCVDNLISSCNQNSQTTWNFDAPYPLMSELTIHAQMFFTIKGRDAQGLCIVEQKTLSSQATISDASKNALIASGTPETQIQLAIKGLNDASVEANKLINTCVGASADFIAFLGDLEAGSMDASCQTEIQSGASTSKDVCTYNGKITCTSEVPVRVIQP